MAWLMRLFAAGGGVWVVQWCFADMNVFPFLFRVSHGLVDAAVCCWWWSVDGCLSWTSVPVSVTVDGQDSNACHPFGSYTREAHKADLKLLLTSSCGQRHGCTVQHVVLCWVCKQPPPGDCSGQ